MGNRFTPPREPESFDLAYSFGVLEQVRDVDQTVEAAVRLLRPGGHFCLVAPMNEVIATRPLPPFVPSDGVAGHVRSFTEAGLRRKFGRRPSFFLEKVLGAWRPDRFPPGIAPVEFGPPPRRGRELRPHAPRAKGLATSAPPPGTYQCQGTPVPG